MKFRLPSDQKASRMVCTYGMGFVAGHRFALTTQEAAVESMTMTIFHSRD